MAIEVIRGKIISGTSLKVTIPEDIAQEYPANQGATLKDQVKGMLEDLGLEVQGIDSIQLIPLPDTFSKQLTLTGERLVRSAVPASEI